MQTLPENCESESEVKSESEVGQLCPTLCDPVDYSPPGFSVHGILQARILDWVAIFFSKTVATIKICHMLDPITLLPIEMEVLDGA